MKPVDLLTTQLQAAYMKAGEDMAKQMAAAVVSILNEVTNGRGMSSFHGWTDFQAPEEFKKIIPGDKLYEASWIVIMSNDIAGIPLFEGKELWRTELTSEHTLLVLG